MRRDLFAVFKPSMSIAAPPHSPFKSFWQAGYEGADHVNRHGQPLRMAESNEHTGRAQEDYRRLAEFNIRTVRESVGWRIVERNGEFDFSSLQTRIDAARRNDIQINWTFLHYGWPDDIDFHSESFVERFARLCGTLAKHFARSGTDAPIYSPVNEISFTSWAIDVGMLSTYSLPMRDQPNAAKRQLVRAAIAGCDAIWQVDPSARILHCDPLIHVAASGTTATLLEQAKCEHDAQFEAWDMLCGQQAADLGGAPRYLDLIGVNYYHANQWLNDSGEKLDWHLGDGRRMPLHTLLKTVHTRYGRPISLAETSHVGSGRGAWLREIAEQTALSLQQGIDLQGVCLYPVVDRPDWDEPDRWHASGLWDVVTDGPNAMSRRLVQPYAAALMHSQIYIDHFISTTARYGNKGISMQTIIVFSHLRWDFVYQRPQHLLTHLAQHYRIAFVEEPVFHAGVPFMSESSPVANVTVYRPHTAVNADGFHDMQIPVLQPMLAASMASTDGSIVWFYTPMALPLLNALHPSLIVYDCMDELAAFKNPPKQLIQRETALLSMADVVFTGGPSLYEAKRPHNPNIYCFASSVDSIHFQQALDKSNVHPLQAGLNSPRLGFYGVIDERFDASLIETMADARPSWQIVLVGPIVKIDPASLPQRPNIHYFGQHPYQALPQFLAGWDVCLLPFAINEATRFISPTKVLEYMAAELPIVSTDIQDVAGPYGDVVSIGHDAAGFIAACDAMLAQSAAGRRTMKQKMRSIVASTSWAQTAEQMHTMMQMTPQRRHKEKSYGVQTPRLPTHFTSDENPATVNALRAPAQLETYACVIAGAGPTGLSAAYHYGEGALLLEKNSTVGGWCRSIKDKGFTFDYAGHIMFSNDAYVLGLYEKLLGKNLHWQNREAWVYSKNVYTRYPFQGALYGLPPAVIKECIVGAMEARFGDLTQTATSRNAAAANEPGPTDAVAASAPLAVDDCCADGTVEIASSTAAVALQQGPRNFEEFIYKVWGSGIAKHFAVPYNKKLWTVPLADMETSWLGGRVPLPDLEDIIEGALEPVGKPMGPNARFGYPLEGGFEALVSAFVPYVQGRIETDSEIVQIMPVEHMVALANGRRIRYKDLLSTLPLPELIRMMGDDVPPAIQAAADGLRHISVRCVNLGIGRADLTDKHWIYYPEQTIFHRIFVQGNASPHCNPPGGFGLTCEISYSPWKPLPVDGDQLIARCVAECIEVGIIDADDEILTANLVDMPYAYVVYDHARANNVAVIKTWLQQHDISLSGRYSEWEYYNSDHAFVAGKKAAEQLLDKNIGLLKKVVD